MRISRVDSFVLLDPNYNIGSTSSAQDDLVVVIHTDDGFSGYGESDVNPWIGRACIEAPGTHTMGQSLREMLIGRDPLKIDSIWEDLYVGSAMNGRRGAVIHALGAIDIALHDLRGKILGRPCYELLPVIGGAQPNTSITPYASLQPEAFTGFDEYGAALVTAALSAKGKGFVAAKLEITPFGPYAHRGLSATTGQMTELIGQVRDAVSADFTLMLDVQYAFPDADTCLSVIQDWQDFNLFFLETPLPSDDVAGYARLVREQSIPIAAGEWLATRFEFLDFMDRGHLNVVQPDVGRVGGLTEAHRVCGLAADRRLLVVPHCWKTGLSIAATAHLAAVTHNCPFIEYLPSEQSDSVLRRRLTKDNLKLIDGKLHLPRLPGLGVEIDEDALNEFAEAARQARSNDDEPLTVS